MRLDRLVTDVMFKQHATMIQTRGTVTIVSDFDDLLVFTRVVSPSKRKQAP